MKTKARYSNRYKMTDSRQFNINAVLGLISIGLCFTGIGALIGIPLFLYVVFHQDVKKNDQIVGGWVGRCPKCREEIVWFDGTENTRQGYFECNNCSVNIEFYDGFFEHNHPSDVKRRFDPESGKFI